MPVSISKAYDDSIGDVLDILWEGFETEDFSRLEDSLAYVFSKAAPSIADINEAAEEWAQQHSTDIIKYLTADQEAAAKTILTRGIQKGLSDDEIAGALEKKIGLTPRYAIAVENFREGLIKDGFSPENARRRASTYAEHLRHSRAREIASTEVQRALNMGQQALWKAALEDGEIPANAQRQWVTHKDEKRCVVCGPLHGLKTPVSAGEWRIRGVVHKAPPVHPNCRCTEILVAPSGMIIKHGKATDGPAERAITGHKPRGAMGNPKPAAKKTTAKLPAGKKKAIKAKAKPSVTNDDLDEVDWWVAGKPVPKKQPQAYFGGEYFDLPEGGDLDAFENLDAQIALAVKLYSKGQMHKLPDKEGIWAQKAIDDGDKDWYYKAIGGADAPDMQGPPKIVVKPKAVPKEVPDVVPDRLKVEGPSKPPKREKVPARPLKAKAIPTRLFDDEKDAGFDELSDELGRDHLGVGSNPNWGFGGQGLMATTKARVNRDIYQRLLNRDDPELTAWADEQFEYYHFTKEWSDNYATMKNVRTRTREEAESELWQEYKRAVPNVDYQNPNASQKEQILAIYTNHAIRGWAQTSGDTSAPAVAMQKMMAEKLGLDFNYSHLGDGYSANGNSDDILARHQPFMEAFIEETYALTQERLDADGIAEIRLFRGVNEYRITEQSNIKRRQSERSKAALERKEEIIDKISFWEDKQEEIDPSEGGEAEFEWEKLDNKIDQLKWELEELDEEITADDRWVSTGKVEMQPLSSFSANRDTSESFGETLLTTVVPAERIFSTANTGFGALNEFEFVVIGNADTWVQVERKATGY